MKEKRSGNRQLTHTNTYLKYELAMNNSSVMYPIQSIKFDNLDFTIMNLSILSAILIKLKFLTNGKRKE